MQPFDISWLKAPHPHKHKMLFIALLIQSVLSDDSRRCNADDLYPTQFECFIPNEETIMRSNLCFSNNTMSVRCRAFKAVVCNGYRTFTKLLDCNYKNFTGYRYDIALGLSIFLGIFGIDRMYLGYPMIGLAKLLTLGGFTILTMIDIVLVATNFLRPADGSQYINVPYHDMKPFGSQTDQWTINATEPI